MNFIVFSIQAQYDNQFLELTVSFYKPFLCVQKNIVFSDCWGCILYAHSDHHVKLINCVVQILQILPNFCVLDIATTERGRGAGRERWREREIEDMN